MKQRSPWYWAYIDCDGRPALAPHKAVELADYRKLEARIKELEEENKALNDELKVFQMTLAFLKSPMVTIKENEE